MASRAEGLRLLLVGSSSSLGGEVKRRLAGSSLPVREAVLAESEAMDEEGARLLSEFGGEAQLVTPLDDVEFSKFDLAILLGNEAEVAPILDRVAEARGCIDLSGASRRRKGVPWMHLGVQPPAEGPSGGLVAGPQPAAATLTSLLAPLARTGELRGASATVLLPASSLGEKAAEELYEQTVGLLNFTTLPKDRLARQLAFNVLPYDDPSRPGSETLAADLAWEVESLLGPDAPRCDLQLLLAPTFHGYGFSVRLELDASVSAKKVASRLAGPDVVISRTGKAPSSPVELQEERRIVVGRIRAAADGAVWLWAVADSLGGGAAANAVRIAEHFAGVEVPQKGNGRG